MIGRDFSIKPKKGDLSCQQLRIPRLSIAYVQVVEAMHGCITDGTMKACACDPKIWSMCLDVIDSLNAKRQGFCKACEQRQVAAIWMPSTKRTALTQ